MESGIGLPSAVRAVPLGAFAAASLLLGLLIVLVDNLLQSLAEPSLDVRGRLLARLALLGPLASALAFATLLLLAGLLLLGLLLPSGHARRGRSRNKVPQATPRGELPW